MLRKCHVSLTYHCCIVTTGTVCVFHPRNNESNVFNEKYNGYARPKMELRIDGRIGSWYCMQGVMTKGQGGRKHKLCRE